jgi:hypothetical protein
MVINLTFYSGEATRTLTVGVDNVIINGVLNVNANQPANIYTGSYVVTANY